MTKLATASDRTDLAKKLAAGKVELQTMRQKLKELNAQKQQLGVTLARKELREKNLLSQTDAILRSAGMLRADLVPSTKSFDAAKAYVAAVEAGDKIRATELFKNHKSEIFALASRN
jgi:hypothetical protein